MTAVSGHFLNRQRVASRTRLLYVLHGDRDGNRFGEIGARPLRANRPTSNYALDKSAYYSYYAYRAEITRDLIVGPPR